ncbi:hypothetical protein [Neisseria elongata]|uniref:hypothetical protein n=1 Tax=Neisseria elongata TaxID=495 RepID=UPI0006675284|nr:hypothetical protein [Neisseria elongata]
MKKILFLLFTIVGVSFPAHAKSNIQKSQDYTPEKGFTIQKDLSYPFVFGHAGNEGKRTGSE